MYIGSTLSNLIWNYTWWGSLQNSTIWCTLMLAQIFITFTDKNCRTESRFSISPSVHTVFSSTWYWTRFSLVISSRAINSITGYLDSLLETTYWKVLWSWIYKKNDYGKTSWRILHVSRSLLISKLSWMPPITEWYSLWCCLIPVWKLLSETYRSGLVQWSSYHWLMDHLLQKPNTIGKVQERTLERILDLVRLLPNLE